MDTISSATVQVLAALSVHSGLILASDAARVGLQHELRREFVLSHGRSPAARRVCARH